MRRHGFLAIMLAGVAAGGAWLLNQDYRLDASEEPSRSFREALQGTSASDAPVEDENGIKLNYFEASWDRVLQNVAEQGKFILVMDKIPHGTYARRDRARYRPESVVRILNAELENQGFRLITQGDYLVVLKLDQARTRYARPTVPPVERESEASSGQQTVDVGPWKKSQFSTASDSNNDASPRVAWASQSRPAAPQATTGEQAEQSAAAPFTDSITPKKAPVEVAREVPKVDDGRLTSSRIVIQNAKAADVARSVYLVFETRAELIRDGLEGLPTFVVKSAGPADPAATTLFRIAIDQKKNELLIEASKTRVKHIVRLVAELDKPPMDDSETVKILPNKGVTDATAKDLNEQIHRMVALRGQAAQANAQAYDSAPGNEQQGEEGSLNLRGEVNVQAMQDLGILIIKGNEADVQKVEAIIKQLEELSVGSLPDVHLLALQHINSESLAVLLTSVYEQLVSQRQRDNGSRDIAAFFPVVQPNAILIVTPKIELEAVLELARQLDRELDPNSQFKVFSLRNAIASQVEEALREFYDERDGLGTRVRIVADMRTNALIVQGQANDLEEVGKLVERFDQDKPGAVHRVEVVELQHATAEELADIVNTAIQSVSSPPQQSTTGGGGFGAGTQGAQELRDSKSVALEFLAASGDGRELLRSGILVDVRINPDPRSNSLIISAPEASMPLLTALIRNLDRPPSAVAEIKVFALKNADASQSVELLTTMFENQNQEEQLGIQISGAEDATSSLIPLTFSADIRTNTVLAVGGAEALSVVEAILLRLDTTDSRQRTTNVIKLENAPASIVAAAMNDFLQQQQGLQDSSEDMISNIERMRQEVIVAPDDNSNSLIVSASPEYYSQIEQIVADLDARPPQVIIQALLVEVALDNTDEFGIELGFQDPQLFNRSILQTAEDIVSITNISQNANGQQLQETVIQSINPTPGFGFNNTDSALGNNTGAAGVNSSVVGAQSLSNFSLGRENGDLGFGGFVFSAQSDAVNVLVRALAARRTVHVLSRPQIRTTDNNLASIQVGQQVPVVNGVVVTDNIVSPDIEQQNVGIILEVTPRVTPDGIINMEVYAEKSKLSGGGVPVFTDVASGNVIESVIIDTAIADTVVAVPNGQTIVIGGMITKTDETLERKVPWLGDLPVLSSLFRYDGTNTVRTELLIFLTPRIIYNDIDSELIKQVESERIHFVESEAEEMHGPLFSVPPSEMDQFMLPNDEDFDGVQPDGYPGGAVPVIESVPPVEGDLEFPPQTRSSSEQPAISRNRLPIAEASDETPSRTIIPTSGEQLSSEKQKPENSDIAADGQEEPGADKTDSAATSWVKRLIGRGKKE
ncbi:MAG: secretin N-terminal domain-containing protein [Fuerstiella sp.]|nr:secretin N-terminal domain-containing protein [Fuerstiella sp.]